LSIGFLINILRFGDEEPFVLSEKLSTYTDMECTMKSKNMIMAFVLSAFIAAPVMMTADCGTKAKAECAKEASKEDGMACCKKKMSSKEAKSDNCSKTSADNTKKEVAPKY
jgi:hypothetical protein